MNFLSKLLSLQAARKTLYLMSLTGLIGGVFTPQVAASPEQSLHNFNDSQMLAQRRRRSYRPPSGSRLPRGNHSGGGVRGCGENIAAIAPRLSGIGHTSSTHPTLVWHIASDEPSPLELHLYRYQPDGSLETVFIRPAGESQKGFMAYSLPVDEPGLQVGETYLWQVVLYCDPNMEEVGMWTAADIQTVPTVESVVAELSEDPVLNAQVYAEAGLWYDAIAADTQHNKARRSPLPTKPPIRLS